MIAPFRRVGDAPFFSDHPESSVAVGGVVGAISGVGEFNFEFWHDNRAWDGAAPSSDEMLWFLGR